MILGPMFSGKTTELMRRTQRRRAIGHRVLAVNHEMDTRCKKDEMQTHSGSTIHATKAQLVSEIVADEYDVIAIDEGQFFPDLDSVMELVGSGKHVIIAALSGDYSMAPFRNVSSLQACADKVQYLTALCVECGDGTCAPFTKRVLKRKGSLRRRLFVGGKAEYKAVCRKHHQSA